MENDDIRFRFIGEKGAANLDLAEEATTRLNNLAVAREMELAERDAKAIKMATGWERGADGKWRYEQDDSQIIFKFADQRYDVYEQRTFDGYLKNIMYDADLFNAYPELPNYKVFIEDFSVTQEENNVVGYVHGEEIHLKATPPDDFIDLRKREHINEAKKSVLVHELQHVIQNIEGFVKGSNTKMFNGATELEQQYATFDDILKHRFGISDIYTILNVLNNENGRYADFRNSFGKSWEPFFQNIKSLYDTVGDQYFIENYKYFVENGKMLTSFEQYERTVGEVEARNVETRITMTPEERRASLAMETEDISRADQIFIKGALESAAGKMNCDPEKLIVSINEYAEELNTPIRIIQGVDELQEDSLPFKGIKEGKDIRAFFDTKSKEIAIYLPNVKSIEDARSSVYHEVVAHYGLRELYGVNFDNFLDNVFENATPEIQGKILYATKGDPTKRREATEEYLARLAEKGFDEPEEIAFFQKVKDLFIDMLRNAGVHLGFKLEDKDLRHILYASYQNLKERVSNIGIFPKALGEAKNGDYTVFMDMANKGYKPSASEIEEIKQLDSKLQITICSILKIPAEGQSMQLAKSWDADISNQMSLNY